MVDGGNGDVVPGGSRSCREMSSWLLPKMAHAVINIDCNFSRAHKVDDDSLEELDSLVI